MKLVDNKTKYGYKTISGYKKKDAIKFFKESLINSDYERSLYFGFELFISGHFNDFWLIVITIMSEYIHIAHPSLPKLMNDLYKKYKDYIKRLKNNKSDIIDLRNVTKMKHGIMIIIKNICKSKKVHIAELVYPIYNTQREKVKTNRDIAILLKNFKDILKVSIKNKQDYRKNSDAVLRNIFDKLGKIMSVDSLSIENYDYPNKINLYHHQRSKVHQKLIQIYWDILFKESSKYNNNITIQLINLRELYERKVTYKLEKESYHILHAVLYLIYSIYEREVKVDNDDISKTNNLYSNIQRSINHNCTREDYIDIKPPKKEKKKKEKKKKPKPPPPITKQEIIEEPEDEYVEESDSGEDFEDEFLNYLSRDLRAHEKQPAIIELRQSDKKQTIDDYYYEFINNFDESVIIGEDNENDDDVIDENITNIIIERKEAETRSVSISKAEYLTGSKKASINHNIIKL